MNELYPSNFNSEDWNCPQFSWDQSYQNSQSNWSYTEPSLPSWRFDNKHKELKSTLEKSLEIMQQSMPENSQINQKMIESYAHIDMHFDQKMTHLN